MTDWIAFWLFCSLASVTWGIAIVYVERTHTIRWQAYYGRSGNCVAPAPSSREMEEEEADDE